MSIITRVKLQDIKRPIASWRVAMRRGIVRGRSAVPVVPQPGTVAQGNCCSCPESETHFDGREYMQCLQNLPQIGLPHVHVTFPESSQVRVVICSHSLTLESRSAKAFSGTACSIQKTVALHSRTITPICRAESAQHGVQRQRQAAPRGHRTAGVQGAAETWQGAASDSALSRIQA